jgi:hypothetical protein
MLRRPESFSIARYRLDAGRLEILRALGRALHLPNDSSHPIEVLRAIVRRRNALAKYAQVTRSIDARAVAVRDTLNTANHPMQLLFKDLPRALGLEPIERGIGLDDARILATEFASSLAESLRSLEGAYNRLLESVQRSLAAALDLSFETAALRAELAERARRIQPNASDLRLRAFLGRVLDADLPHREWLESITTIVIVPQRPPREWTDGELARFEIGLTELRSLFSRAEDFALGLSGGKDSSALAIYLRERVPEMEYVFCDTGKELPETYEFLTKMEAYLGKPIQRLMSERDFDHYLDVFNGYLPSSRMRWCTRLLKLKPFEQYVGNDPVINYVGIRADEQREGYISTKPNITSVFPFRDDGIAKADVLRILEESGVGIPEYYRGARARGALLLLPAEGRVGGAQAGAPGPLRGGEGLREDRPGDGGAVHVAAGREPRRADREGGRLRRVAPLQERHATAVQ